MACNVCSGLGDYPIFTENGLMLYSIPCPECAGSGLSLEEDELRRRQRSDAARYEAAMAEMRNGDERAS